MLAGGADVGDADGGLLAAADAVPVRVADSGPVQRTPNGQMICEASSRSSGKRPLTWTYSVDRRLQHTNRYATVLTCGFLLPLVRERRAATAGATGSSR